MGGRGHGGAGITDQTPAVAWRSPDHSDSELKGLPQSVGVGLLLVRFAMKPSGLVILASSVLLLAAVRAADATSPVDAAQRNTPFAPGAATATAPTKQKPATNEIVQEKRVEKTTIDKRNSPLAERRAAVELQETRPKNVQEKDSRRPETVEHATSAFNHRPAAITTADDTTKPPTVAKYQDSLTAASATNMARFPALDRATGAKINRFVFRKNPPDPTAALEGAAVTRAGGPALPK